MNSRSSWGPVLLEWRIFRRWNLLDGTFTTRARDTKWEGGNFPLPSKLSIEREQRLYNLVSDYSNRDLLTYLRGIAHNCTV